MDVDNIPPDDRAAARRRLRGFDADSPSGSEARVRSSAEARKRQRAQTERWKKLNPERVRKSNRESMHRAAQLRRKVQAKRDHGRAWYHEHREQERERSRRFRADNPGKVREYQQRYRERHPDRAAAQSRQQSMRWRDKNADAQRAAGRERAARRRAADPDINRRNYQANLEELRARGRDESRRRSRLKQLGLPPRRIHRVYANEKRANAAAADAFFARHRSAPQKRDLLLERDAPPHTRLARADGRRRAIAPAQPEQLIDLAAATTIAAEQQMWVRVLPDMATEFVRRNRARIQEEIRMDSIARQQVGKAPYDPSAELARRLQIEVFKDAAKRLTPDGDSDRRRRLFETMFPATASGRQALDPTPRRVLAQSVFGSSAGIAR